MDSNGDNSDTDIQVSESSFSASNSSFSSSFCCKSKRSSSIGKQKSLFLLGRWVCQLQQCLKLLLERIQIFQPKGAVKKNLFFVHKVKENLKNVEDFCRKIVVFLNRSAPDYGSNQNQKVKMVLKKTVSFGTDFAKLRQTTLGSGCTCPEWFSKKEETMQIQTLSNRTMTTSSLSVRNIAKCFQRGKGAKGDAR
jgi:hypothetical protein